MLEVRVQKRRGGFLLDVAFEAPTPGVVALFGRSGAGKTTAIDLIAGLLQPDTGRIAIDGELLFERGGIDVPPEKRRIGYVFQDARLFPHLSVRGNLRYGEQRAPGRARSIGLDEIVELLGLRELLGRRPQRLSGGERQRAAIGRALLAQPRLLLLDEPLAGVDRARREEVLPYLERLRDRFRIPIVYVSHQFEEVLRLATHVVLLERGRVAAQGEVASVSRDPALRAVLGPGATGAVIEAEVEAGAPGWLSIGAGRISVGADLGAPGRRRLHVLARDVIVATQEPKGLVQASALPAVISALEPEASDTLLAEVDVGGARLISRLPTDRARALGLAPGSRVWVVLSAASLRGDLPAATS
jgi:molybdate transport system ATP-binding protein